MPAISRNGGPTNNPEVTRQAPPKESTPLVLVGESGPEPVVKPAEQPAAGRSSKAVPASKAKGS